MKVMVFQTREGTFAHNGDLTHPFPNSYQRVGIQSIFLTRKMMLDTSGISAVPDFYQLSSEFIPSGVAKKLLTKSAVLTLC